MSNFPKESFSRIHTLKFQNKLAKETMKRSLKSIVDKFFSEGLLFSLFVDIDDTTLYYINVWDSLDATERVRNKGKYKEFFEQVREMGIKLTIVEGSTEVRFSDSSILDKFVRIDGE